MDALTLLLLIEALFLVTALSVFLYLKVRRYQGLKTKGEKPSRDFQLFLQTKIDEIMKEMTNVVEEGDSSVDVELLRETHSVRAQYLKSALDSVNKSDDFQWHTLWNDLYKSFEDISKGILLKNRDLLLAKESAAKRLKQVDTLQGEDGQTGPKTGETYEGLIKENEGLKSELQGFKERLDATNKEIETLRAKSDTLEQEYLVLYKESQRST
jgi:hypothetical protein